MYTGKIRVSMIKNFCITFQKMHKSIASRDEQAKLMVTSLIFAVITSNVVKSSSEKYAGTGI